MPRTSLARTLRQQSTWAEKLMWRWLRGRRFNHYKFRRQHPVGKYIVDFFCEEARLAVELDGRGHGHPLHHARDVERDEFLVSQGIKTIRFWNHQLRREKRLVRDAIFNALQSRAPHPLPDYTRPLIQAERKRVSGDDRPHPDPLPRGEGEGDSGDAS